MALKFLNSGYFAGKVGIGVEAPLTNLDILGTTDTYLTIRNTGGGFKSGIRMYGGTAGISNIWHDDTEDNPPGIHFGTSANIATTPTTQLYIKGSNGNVGIGTTSPSNTLQVGDGTEDSAIAVYYSDGSYTRINGYGLYMSRTASYIRPTATTTKTLYIGAPSNIWNAISNNANTHYFVTGTNEHMRINSAGNVGINTTSPDFKLDVDGTFGVSDLPFNTDSVSVLVADEITGVEEVTNGSFTTDADWNKNPNWTISGGTANADGTSNADMNQIPVNGYPAVGEVFRVSFEVTARTQGQVRIIYGGASTAFVTVVGKYEYIITATTTDRIRIQCNGSFIGSVDNLSIKQITSASNQIQKRELGTGAFGPTPVGAYLPLAGGTMTGQLFMGSAGSGTFSNELKFTNSAYVAGIDYQNNGNLRLIDRSNSRVGAYINLLNGEFAAYNTGNVITTLLNTNGNSYLNGGNVGIGTTNPLFKLDVAGEGNFTSYLNVNSSAGIRSTGWIHLQRYATNLNVSVGNNGTNVHFLVPNGDVRIKTSLLSNQENTDIDTGAEVVAQVAIATYTAAFFDFVVKKGTNVRSGTVYACHDGDTTPLVEFTETSTNDLGDTSDVTLSVDISGTNMRLLATVTSNDWSVKSLIRAI